MGESLGNTEFQELLDTSWEDFVFGPTLSMDFDEGTKDDNAESSLRE